VKSTKVNLAGRDYTIESLKFRAERAWRKKYDVPIANLIGAISNVRELSSKEFDTPSDLLKEVGMLLLSHANELMKALLDSPDIIFDAICDYSPALAADRDFIEENSYQDEIAVVFVEVLKIAYPFGSLLGIAQSLGNIGSQEKQTSQSSPLPSGESGKTT
jgi:hypothetical protein